jgi:hypothetical protein
MTKEQIETALLEQRAKWLEKLDLVNKLTTAVADVRHHQAPSKKIVTAFQKRFGDEYKVYWDSGKQEKYDMRQLSAWGKGVLYDDRVYISCMPDRFTWDYLFEQLRNQDTYITKSLGELAVDLTVIDEMIEWDRITRLSLNELLKARPTLHWPLNKCFGEIKAQDNPSEFPTR